MSNKLTYGNIELANADNKGILVPDKDGYYTIAGGGFNMPNRMGIVYRMNQYLLECLEEGPTVGSGSDLRRRIERGEAYMEMNHPVQWFYEKVDGQVVRTRITDLMTWINRLKTIDMDRICASIGNIIPNFDKFNRATMQGPVTFDIETKPHGPFGHMFKENLDTPRMGTAVSIRTVTAPQQFGAVVREVEYWTGLDWVPEPGFAEATKYRTDMSAVGGMESLIQDLSCGESSEITLSAKESIEIMETCLGNKNDIVTREGMESFNQLNEMLSTLKKNRHFVNGERKTVTTVNPMNLF
ncbi:head maturation protease [Vibrio phage USC-1]|uniref:Virion structural protein n=2 Tax=Aphroditevirus USC1 TaxID=2846605 RepID=A0A514A2U2_9CAUD|nr:head maturation protease [Vibrio phage USC-1]QCW23146.1 hypothetical protein [Vibrio phage 5 TSL-2019]QDH47581.1 hypothetical protein [Vibrio phage USC-1]